ncbi:alpha/beta hydrolase [Aspergillus saccharolyticus JOP 1030-1]|uniref:Alpha/beta hydrolase fold-3 domain-containing protein n=1 Tax=Aspergillus saccharolyticus JOP 1030-1 TaxID=1450539 RepID=A0A318ZLR6_9EURO|nr:alpha/beta hydrolase fold-3 domain-containing protein [Aspergillus saccharolyticus JOP 1030-1]PYH48551.1 alpha/beta hydrolase fold-3 domain-containing protein [Aspergillus saccharolyticus JOP 1030-1]
MGDYSTPESVRALSIPDPELVSFLQDNAPAKIDFTADRHLLRGKRSFAEKERADATPTYGTHEFTKALEMRDGYQSEARFTQPAESTPAGRPLIILVYGGGWLLGSNYQLIPFARPLAHFYKATVVTVSYRLGPEYKFPIATQDIYDSIKWLALNAASFGANPDTGFIVGGVSAGATMTAVVAQMLAEEKFSPPLTGQWLSVPNLFCSENVPERYRHLWLSRRQNTDAPGLTTNDLEILDRSYEPDLLSPAWSPVNSGPPAKSLPPAYIQVAGCDPLRDDGIIWESMLRESGIKTKLDVYPGVPHVHFASYPNLKLSRKSNLDTLAGIGWLLGEILEREKIDDELKSAPGGG